MRDSKKRWIKKKQDHPKSTKDRKRVLKLIYEYKKRLGVGHFNYEVRFLRGKEVQDYYAEASMHGKRVILCFNEDLMELRPSSVEDTVVHELLHVVLYKLMDKTEAVIRRYVHGSKAKRRLENRFDKLEHLVIDDLTSAFLRGR